MDGSSPARSDVTDDADVPAFVTVNSKSFTRMVDSQPSTPRKRPRSSSVTSNQQEAGAPATSLEEGKNIVKEQEFPTPAISPVKADSTLSPIKKKAARGSPAKSVTSNASPSKAKKTIATSPSEMSLEDKLMMDLKEEKGMTWGQIKDEIEKLTGTQTNAKSLSKRYSRLKSNFGAGEFDESDVPIVLQCKQEIESKFQTELYARIAEMMKAKGRKEYTPAVIRKKVNELTKGKEVLDVMLDSCTS